MITDKKVTVIGAGLAGCEAALQLAAAGIKVKLIDIKPKSFTPAHKNPMFGELVCSNSLKSDEPFTASGMLKAELNMLGCRLLDFAIKTRVPAGGALAVERELFARLITEEIKSQPLIETVCAETEDFDEDEYTIIATGPLTQGKLYDTLSKKLGEPLHFYDAAAPIIDASTIDYEKSFTAARYGRGGSDYVNCPMTENEYSDFYQELINAETAEKKDFEKNEIFEGCMPVEVMAKKGFRTLCFGPLRPVGFGEKGSRPFAVVQLRRENSAGTAYNMVGFQTNLKFPEQKRVFRLIPALNNAEFLRYGVMHRNSYIEAPKAIDRHFKCKKYPKTYIAGQLSGVEGYVESIMSGLVAARSVIADFDGAQFELPPTTISGALCRYLETASGSFQPMNANFGLIPPADIKTKDKKLKNQYLFERGIKDLKKAGF